MYYLIHWIVSAIALLLTARLISGFTVANFSSALWSAVAIGLANIVVWPLLLVLTLPINILTFGLFTFVINAAVLKICAAVMPGFSINGWGTAILGSIVLSIVSTLLHYVFV